MQAGDLKILSVRVDGLHIPHNNQPTNQPRRLSDQMPAARSRRDVCNVSDRHMHGDLESGKNLVVLLDLQQPPSTDSEMSRHAATE